MKPKVVIIGGGVAGLAFAINYRKLGGEVEIYERSCLSGREGLGFIMLKNGTSGLQRLGLVNRASNRGKKLDECVIYDERNHLLVRESINGGFGTTRKAFVDLLLEQIPSSWIHYDCEFSHFEWGEQGQAKYACFKNGKKATGDYFLGCDGANSQVREQIFPDAAFSNLGVKELVSVVDCPEAAQYLGDRFIKFKSSYGGLAVGMLPADKQRVVWFIQYGCDRYDITDYSREGKSRFAKERIGGWSENVDRLITKTDFSKSHIWDSNYLKPLPRLYRENIVLMGDAAHKLMPFTSQGVNSAIDDALALCDVLDRTCVGYANTALEHFSVMRQKAINKYIAQGLELQSEFFESANCQQKIPFAL